MLLPSKADGTNCASGIGKTVILLLSQIDTVLKCSPLLPAMHSQLQAPSNRHALSSP